MPAIEVSTEGRVATVAVNRPEALNAMNSDVLREMLQAFVSLGHREDVGAVILTGSGSKAFIAGADISEMKDMSPEEASAFVELGQMVTTTIERIPQPVIAAVNGFALGGGCEVALACDIRLCAENARFGQPGITPRYISGWPKRAFYAQSLLSQASATSQPPPRAKPLTAAITGCGMRSMVVVTICPSSTKARASSGDISFISEISAPAMNALLPEPVRITAPTSSLCPRDTKACSISRKTSLFMAFSASGLFTATVATRPSVDTSIAGIPTYPLSWGSDCSFSYVALYKLSNLLGV